MTTYIALKSLVYSEGGPGHEDANGNWHGDRVEAGETVSVAHLNASQIQLLINMKAIAEMPEIKIEKPAPAKPAKDEKPSV